MKFKMMYEAMTYSYIIASRSNKDGVLLELELLEIEDEDYLRNAAAYIIAQPTKDGKQIMPYDYRWGTASMYFRPNGYPQIWRFDANWDLKPCCTLGSLTIVAQRKLLHTKYSLPHNWIVCNGLVLPTNYVEKEMFERIFGTFNRFRVFLAAGKNQQQIVVDKIAAARGINIDDIEARQLACSISEQRFGKKDSRWLSPPQRLELARELRHKYRLSIRQISSLSRLPEREIRKYIK